MADHRLRIEKPLILPATTIPNIEAAFHTVLQSNHPLRMHVAAHMALVCLTAHRGSSITRIQMRDIFTCHPGLGKGWLTIFNWIQNLAMEARTEAQLFLFGVHKQSVQKISQTMLPFRETRRAILRLMAFDLKIPPEDILLFSRHTTTQRLRTYLGAGLYLSDEARRTMPVTSHLTSLIPALL